MLFKQTQQLIDVTLRVTAQKLPIILQALDHDAELVSAVPAPGDTPPMTDIALHRKRRPPEYAHGIRDKGITGRELALTSVEQAPKSKDELERIFIAAKFKPGSAGSRIAQLRTDGLVRLNSDGKYERVR